MRVAGVLGPVPSPWDIQQVHPVQVQEMLERGDDLVLIDVREPWEVEAASIAGSLNIPTYEIQSRTGEIPRDKDVVLYCHTGSRSMMAAVFLRRLGYTRVSNMAGGIDRWSQEVDPSVPRYE